MQAPPLQNCDEQWPVFDEDQWPQRAVECAGRKAGKCETIARVGWTQERVHDKARHVHPLRFISQLQDDVL